MFAEGCVVILQEFSSRRRDIERSFLWKFAEFFARVEFFVQVE